MTSASYTTFKYKDGTTGYDIRYKHNGKHKKKRIKKGRSLNEVKLILAKLRDDLDLDERGIKTFIDPFKYSTNLTISNYLEWFLDNKVMSYGKGGQLSSRTIDMYKRAFRILKEVYGNILIDELTPEKINQFKKFLVARYRPNTISMIVRSLRAAWNLGIERKIVKSNPFKFVPITRRTKDPRFWTVEEMDRIFNCLDNKDVKVGFLFARYAGLRKIEICQNLRWEKCFWNQNYGIIDRAKTSEDQTFVILPQLKKEIQPFIQKEGFVCNVRYDNLDKFIRKARLKAGVQTSGAVKILRHSLARNLILQGKDIYFVKEVLRHSSIQTTERYLVFKTSQIAGALEGVRI